MIDDSIALGNLEELWIGLGGGEPVDRKDLSAAGGAIDFGDEVDAEMRGVPELPGTDERLIVAHPARVKGSDVAIAGDIFAAGVAGSELLVLLVAPSVAKGPSDANGGFVDRISSHAEVQELADLRPDRAVVPGVLSRIHDLDDLQL